MNRDETHPVNRYGHIVTAELRRTGELAGQQPRYLDAGASYQSELGVIYAAEPNYPADPVSYGSGSVVEFLTGSKLLLDSGGTEVVNGTLDLTGATVIGSNIGTVSVITRVYTANATWTKPAGLVAVEVECVGGGATGGDALTSVLGNAAVGGGGGGGEWAYSRILAASLSSTETVTVGAGGPDGDSGGTSGGASSFGSHTIANGGILGTTGADLSPPTMILGGVGGFGGTGDLLSQGDSGGLGVLLSSTDSSAIAPGSGGASHYSGVRSAFVDATQVSGYGCGGTGGAKIWGAGPPSDRGGPGRAGLVIVREIYNVGGGAMSVSNSDGTLTVSPTTGNVVASLNLNHANTWTALQTLQAFKLTASPTNGYVLTSDASGNGTWAAAGGGMTIGGAVSGGTATRVLFEGAGPVLADDSKFIFDSTNGQITVVCIAGSGHSAGVFNNSSGGGVFSVYLAGDLQNAAGAFADASNNCKLCDTSYAVNATAGDINTAGVYRVAGTAGVSGTTIEGDTITGGLTTNIAVSDGRYKRDVRRLRRALEKVLRLRPVRYLWSRRKCKKDGVGHDGRRHLGLIAQDVAAVLPEAAQDSAGVKSYSLPAVVAALVGAVQELAARLAKLEG